MIEINISNNYSSTIELNDELINQGSLRANEFFITAEFATTYEELTRYVCTFNFRRNDNVEINGLVATPVLRNSKWGWYYIISSKDITALDGDLHLTIKLNNLNEDEVITTTSFTLHVEHNAIGEEQVLINDAQYNALLDKFNLYLTKDAVDFTDKEVNINIDGSPKGVYANLSALQTAYPNGASGVYITSDNGHWYYWNGSAWTDGGVYQSSEDVEKLKDDLGKLADYVTVEKVKDVTTNWSYGLLSPNGHVSESSSYIYSDKIAVNEGDIVRLRRGIDNGEIPTGIRLCAYNGDTPVPALGYSDNYSFPVTIGSGITHIAVTLSGAYNDVNPYYSLTYEETKVESKSYTKEEINTLFENVGAVKTVNGIEPDSNGNIEISQEKHTLLVTQTEQITTVQKQIVESQIDVVDSARNAANHGVLPSNDGTTNYTNFQTLIDGGGTIVIDVQGVYEINGMLLIGSDTELIFGKGVFMKQMNTSGGFIVNKGASTNTYNENIRISGLNLICNGKTGDSATYRTGLRGKIAFGFVKNLILDDIYVDDIPSVNYFIHIAAYDNVLIQNCHIQGDKDGIHSSCGEHLTIRNCYFNTKDDPIALNCQDYPSSIPYYGWIKNVLIENCVDDSPSGTDNASRARSILIYGGAWDKWALGNTYRNGDTIVASNDCVYRFISQTAISDATAIASTVEPTHRSKNVTESDGCTWQFVQDTPVYNVACENVTIRNYYVRCSRIEVLRIHNDNSQYVRSIYPSAIMPQHKNIIIDSVSISDDATTNYLIGQHEPVDGIKLINSRVNAIYIIWVSGTYSIASENSATDVVLVGNALERTTETILILSQQANKTTNVKTYGNFAKGSVSNSVTNGTVNMIANDLFN